jgi:hypothetical protein
MAAATKDKAGSFRSQAEAAIKDYDGWTVAHAQAPTATTAPGADGSTVSVVKPGALVATRRAGLTLVEQHGETPEQLAERVADWEASQAATEPRVPTAEQVKNGASATLHQAITAGAREAVDVVLPQEQQKVEGKSTRLVANPVIEEVGVDKDDQARLAAAQPESDLEGTGPV